MSRHQTIKILRAELDRINQEIDLRIIKGVSYAREAKRHKFLRSQLNHISPWPSRFLGKLSYITMFMF